MTALESEYRYLIRKAKTPEQRKALVHHAMMFDLDLSDLL
jgi:hypothetical protein